jgi:hypothetical protein
MHASSRRTPRSRGQIVVIFAISVMAFVGLCAIVIDVSWYWASSLRMQRAADAAALAGVIRLPADFTGAQTLARAESRKNGFEDGVDGVSVTPIQDPTNNRRLRVTITADIGTFFARVIGVNSFHTSRSSKAEYVLPVPMGSPENYYGVYGLVRHCSTAVAGTVCNQTGGTTEYPPPTSYTDTTTSYFTPSSAPSGTWTTPTNTTSSNNAYATSITANQYQTFGTFNIALNSTVTAIKGIEVSAEMSKTGTGASCQIQFELSGDNRVTYTTGAGTGVKLSPNLTTTDTYTSLGGPTDLWGKAAGYWTTSRLNNTNFWVRARAIKTTTAACAAAAVIRIDHLRVRVTYDYDVTNPSIFTPDTVNVAGPQGQVLTPRGFWGMMLTQGAETIAGDAYLPKYDTAGGTVNPNYDAVNYYNYAIEMAAGSTGGSVWIYDPGFCAGALTTGLGDTWIGSKVPISSFYDLYDTMGTPYDLTDDTLVPGFSSGNTFKNQDGSDPALSGSGGSGIAGCDAYHLGWYQLGTSTLAGGAAGHTYRMHTRTTDPNFPNDQLNANARNGWALFTRVTGGTAPRVYGIGAMEMYTPLPSSTSSEFYLAQIEAAHAGKTMEIRLFDAGDTNQDANIQILIPTSGGWSATNFNYTAAKGTTNSGATNCNSSAGTNVSNVVTYQSGASRFNGCWITIQIPIPTTYTAPQSGWWKIRYNMTGSGSTATDITTWQVQIRGNPVHLILP